MPAHAESTQWATVFSDDFQTLPLGPIPTDYSPLGEYHDIRKRPLAGDWQELTFHTSWHDLHRWVVGEADGTGYVQQTSFLGAGWPILAAGASDWQDYEVSAAVRPLSSEGPAGVLIRVEDPRHWIGLYFDNNRLVLGQRDDRTNRELASVPLPFDGDRWHTLTVRAVGLDVYGFVDAELVVTARVEQVTCGRAGLMGRVPVRFRQVRVRTPQSEAVRLETVRTEQARRRRSAREALAHPKLWRRHATPGFGVGKSVRFGDLTGDGELAFLLAQNVPQSGYNFDMVSCLTALSLDGRVLWQSGRPDPGCDLLTNDVAFQIHDIDGDGRNEVIYTKDFRVIICDGATGKEKHSFPTPRYGPSVTWLKEHIFHRIVGDSIFFCDLEGLGQKRNMLLKDRYNNVWAYSTSFEVLWHYTGNTGHYPYALDINQDGRDEVLVGYTLLSPDGKALWTLPNTKDHADGVAFAPIGPGGELRALFAGGDDGILIADLSGNVLVHDFPGHAQCAHVANLDPEREGLEIATITFWGDPGIVVIYDQQGNRIHRFSPFPIGSHLTPTNWTGDGQEHLLLSPRVADGGLWNAKGEQVLALPDDGHPTLCCEPVDLTGDARDEIVVWDTESIWVYTQDRPFDGPRLYAPHRNEHANYSNYRTLVSVPAWTGTSQRG